MGLFSAFFGKSKESAIGKQIKLRAEEFVITYGNQYKGLDYSQQSLTVLDRLLVSFREIWNDMSDDDKTEVLTNISSYMLWVAKTQYNGNFYWSEKHAQPVLVIGEPDYRVAFMPQAEVKNSIEQDNAHPLAGFYRKISDELQKATPQTNILIA